ncbi:hypothetical protein IWZ01DRAFT_493130 [Phyllosticta capitalensis]
MAPPIEHFHPEELEARVQYKTDGRYRKGGVDLEKCKLMEMVQYDCWPERRGSGSVVKCKPLVRLFRKYVVASLLLEDFSRIELTRGRAVGAQMG